MSYIVSGLWSVPFRSIYLRYERSADRSPMTSGLRLRERLSMYHNNVQEQNPPGMHRALARVPVFANLMTPLPSRR